MMKAGVLASARHSRHLCRRSRRRLGLHAWFSEWPQGLARKLTGVVSGVVVVLEIERVRRFGARRWALRLVGAVRDDRRAPVVR